MMTKKIKEDIKGLSIEEIIEIAHYIDQTLEDLWHNDLTISQIEKTILDARISQLDKSPSRRYNLIELSEGISAIKEQKKIEGDLAISLSKNEEKELDRRLLDIEQGKTKNTEFRQAFKELTAWANTK